MEAQGSFVRLKHDAALFGAQNQASAREIYITARLPPIWAHPGAADSVDVRLEAL